MNVTHIPTLQTGRRWGAAVVLLALLGGSNFACERLRVAESNVPKARAGTESVLAPETEAQVELSGRVSSIERDGTHQLAVSVFNRSEWSVTAVRVRVDFRAARETVAREYVLRSRDAIRPGETETLSAVLGESSDHGQPPEWQPLSVSGHPPRS
jgi:hypothetical protein